MAWASVPLTSVTITDPFWKEWQRVVIEQSLPHQWQQIESTGRMDNFRKTAAGEQGGFIGALYNDSDVYKWSEAAAYACRLTPDSPTLPQLNEVAEILAKAQDPTGYLNTCYQLSGDRRWKDLCSDHEMYCMGHLIEAACGAYEAAGRTDFLAVAKKVAACAADTFGPERNLGYCGHQELELALCRLTDCTGEPQWRELARWMTMRRGGRPSPFEREAREAVVGSKAHAYRTHFLLKGDEYDGRYLQDDMPLEDQDEPVGHSVRAMYFYCGAHDSHPDGLPPKLEGALKTIWRRLIDRRTYITGGIGSSAANEGFTQDYDLPNLKAYAETCAGIGLIFWATRMANLTGESEPIDVVERVLYNAVLSGIGQDGRSFFYDNPLESAGGHERKPWFSCACCPPNIARLILSLGRYVASQAPGSLSLNLLMSSRIEAQGMTVEVESGLPWSGQGEVRILSAPDEEREIRIRSPRWACSAQVQGFERTDEGWWTLRRRFSAGDTFAFDFKIEAEVVASHSEVIVNRGRRAVIAGPLVHCLEEPDVPGPATSFVLDKVGAAVPLSGLGTAKQGLAAEGWMEEKVDSAEMPDAKVEQRPLQTTLIPYYSWANRGGNSMAVWLRRG
jgi:uncharacterized protein